MSLAITATIQEKQNVILPLAFGDDGAAVRLAALTNDYIGKFTVSGARDKIVWTLFRAPTWLTVEVDPTSIASNSNVAILRFTNPNADKSTFN
jgi:hypothetical protein